MAKSKEVFETRDIYTGAPNAPVTLVCYMDYESVACANLNAILNQLLLMHKDKVRINIRHFPMASIHQKAMKAAEAVVAAAQEGLFWEMHNIIFENQKKLGTISLQQYARQIGIKNKKFLDYLMNGNYAWQVRDDLLEGAGKGVKSAPTVFINGKLYGGEITFEGLGKVIENVK